MNKAQPAGNQTTKTTSNLIVVLEQSFRNLVEKIESGRITKVS